MGRDHARFPRPPAAATPMHIAFHLHAVRSHFAAALPTAAEQVAAFDWVAARGFDGVDISDSWGFANVDAAAAATTRRLLAERGLVVGTMSCMGRTLCHPDLGERNAEALMATLDVAAMLDCPLINVALGTPRTPGVVPRMGAADSPGGSRSATDSDFAITAERLRAVARRARGRGISLSVEMHDRGLPDTSASLLRILRDVAEPNIGANPDLTNGYRAYDVPPETWQDALRALAPHANLWHVSNMQRVHFAEIARAAFVERPLGDGDVDYRAALAIMRQAGFDGWTVIEYKGLGDAYACIGQGKRYLDEILGRARRDVDPADPRPSNEQGESA